MSYVSHGRQQNRGSYRNSNRSGSVNRRSSNRVSEEYVYGNAARALQPVMLDREEPKKISDSTRRNRNREARMSIGWVMFLFVAIAITGGVCIQYLQLQSQVTNQISTISALEVQLNSLKAENDDTESRIKGAVDLEQIKQKAMNDLGMQYARQDQIETYSSDDDDYVRQYIDIK